MQERGKIKDKKEAILNSALTLITQYGLHGISMKMIADEANVAAGTIYVYFKNKEEMLASLYNRIVEEINFVVSETFDNQVCFKNNFIKIWSEIMMCYIEDQRVPDFILQYGFLGSNVSADRQFLSPIYELFEKGKKEQLLKEIPVTGLIALAHGPITSLVRMSRQSNTLFTDIDVSQYAAACWDSIRR